MSDAAERKLQYQGRVLGNSRTEYSLDFPTDLIQHPPLGWKFRRVTLWRKGKGDECWRVLFIRRNLRKKREPPKLDGYQQPS